MDALVQEYVVQNVLEARLRDVPEYSGVRVRDRGLPNLGEECLTVTEVGNVYELFRKTDTK
jgi:hypothetical protein